MAEQDAIDVLLLLKQQQQQAIGSRQENSADVAPHHGHADLAATQEGQDPVPCPRDSGASTSTQAESASAQVASALHDHLLRPSSPVTATAITPLPQQLPSTRKPLTPGKRQLQYVDEMESLQPTQDNRVPASSLQTVAQQSSQEAAVRSASVLSLWQEPAAVKPQPKRLKPVSPACTLVDDTLPLVLRELAAIAQPPLSRATSLPKPAAELPGLTPSAGSAFSAVPALPKLQVQEHGNCAPYLAEGLLHLLNAGALSLLPCAPSMPLPAVVDNTSDSVDPASSGSEDMPAAPPSPPHAVQQALRFELLKKVAARQAALVRYLQKRKSRSFTKKVLYVSRKRLAEARPRVRGQFVKAISTPVAASVT